MKGQYIPNGNTSQQQKCQMETFSEKLRSRLCESNMTQRDLCSLTGLSQGAISKYLNGKQEPKSRELRLISVALGVSMDSWFDDFEKPASIISDSDWKSKARSAEYKLSKLREAIRNFNKVVENLEGAL